MLKKVVVKNVGVLKAFDTPNSPRLAKLTTIYGRNGRGKTTFSTILRAAAHGDAAPLKGRRTLGGDGGEPEVTLLFETGTIRFANGNWSQKNNPIEVFDAAFIADNLYAGEAVDLEHDRGLFTIILGQAGVKLAKQQEFFNGAAKKASAAMRDADIALKDDLPTDLSREEFFALLPSDAMDLQIDEVQKNLKAVQHSHRLTNLKDLEEIPCPVLDTNLSSILGQTIDTIEVSARDRLAHHFSKFKLGKHGEAWVKFGLDHVHDDNCPFCGKMGVNDLGLPSLYGQIFGESYKAHFEVIRAAIDALEGVCGSERRALIAKSAASNSERFNDWSEFYNFRGIALPSLEGATTKLFEGYQILQPILDAKRQAPLNALYEDLKLSKVAEIFDNISSALQGYNDSVKSIGLIISERSSATRSSEQQLHLKLANLLKHKRRLEPGVQSRIKTALNCARRETRVKKIRTQVQQRLKSANESAASHYYEKVNGYLKKFGATFDISKISNSMTGNIGSVDYGLIVRGHTVARGRGRSNAEEPTFKNTLSTGDKTTLAFAFFLASLDRHSSLADKVLVFDDPLSSHDTHRQSKTIDILVDLCGGCEQMIVLSHDAHFLRTVSKRCVAFEQVCYEMKYDGAENWSKASIGDLDELCQSDSALQLKKLKTFYETREGSPSDVAPAIRKILETHYRRSYSAYFDPDQNLGGIAKAIRDHGPTHPCFNELSAIENCNANTLSQHHGANPEISADQPIDPDDLQSLVRECLQLINAIRV